MRAIVCLLFAGAIVIGCKNEPYGQTHLAVASLANHSRDSAATFNYTYRGGRIYTFQASGKTTPTSMRFNYDFSNGQLIDILIDSSNTDGVASYKIDKFYGYGTSVVTDTTTMHSGDSGWLFSTRTVNYNEGKPVTVNLKIYGETIVEQNAELTWEDGNVVRLVITTGAGSDVSIEYDNKNSAYKNVPDYVYTLPLKELYKLSDHNPTLFTDASGEKKYTYSYNKFDYPISFKNEKNIQFGLTYSAVTPVED